MEVEGLMRGCGLGTVDGMPVIRGLSDHSVDGGLVIGSVCDCEVGQSGDTDGRGQQDRRPMDHSRFCSDTWFEWRDLEDLRLEFSARKSKSCDDGSCSGVFLVRAGGLWPTGSERRWGVEAFPTTLS